MFIELLVALVLLTAFALVATRVFTSSMRVTVEAPLAEQQILAFDSMQQAMRADVCSAASVRVTDETHVMVGGARWAVADDGAVVRTSGDAARTWPGVGARVRFESDDAGVVLRVLDRRGTPSDRILLVNELARLGRAAP
jgi:type II secretory pathway pseudopilin PulG